MYLPRKAEYRLLWLLRSGPQRKTGKALGFWSFCRMIRADEDFFREMYVAELRKKSDKDLEDERKRVNQQGMKTPGRRGEQIKHEEIDREIIRRHCLIKN